MGGRGSLRETRFLGVGGGEYSWSLPPLCQPLVKSHKAEGHCAVATTPRLIGTQYVYTL